MQGGGFLSLPVHYLNLKSSDEDVCGGGESWEEGEFPKLLTLSFHDGHANRQERRGSPPAVANLPWGMTKKGERNYTFMMIGSGEG